MSGACILFLFWSITHLVRKLVVTDENNITRGRWLPSWVAVWWAGTLPTFSAIPSGSALWKARCMPSPHCSLPSYSGSYWNGRRRQRASQWPLADSHCSPDRSEIGVHCWTCSACPPSYWYTTTRKVPNANARGLLLALLASGILVAAVPTASCRSPSWKWAAGLNCSSSTRWACPFQHGCHRIYHPVGSLPHLGYLRKPTERNKARMAPRSYSPSPCWVSRSTDTVPAR